MQKWLKKIYFEHIKLSKIPRFKTNIIKPYKKKSTRKSTKKKNNNNNIKNKIAQYYTKKFTVYKITPGYLVFDTIYMHSINLHEITTYNSTQ